MIGRRTLTTRALLPCAGENLTDFALIGRGDVDLGGSQGAHSHRAIAARP